MRNVWYTKTFVLVIIVLFLGVGFQPALANEIPTNIVSDVDEDCLECQPVSRIDLLKIRLLLTRIEVFTKIIMQRFGHIPEVSEKCDEILNIIDSSNIQWDYPLMCVILISILVPLVAIIMILDKIENGLREVYPNLSTLLIIFLIEPLFNIFSPLSDLAIELDCIKW